VLYGLSRTTLTSRGQQHCHRLPSELSSLFQPMARRRIAAPRYADVVIRLSQVVPSMSFTAKRIAT